MGCVINVRMIARLYTRTVDTTVTTRLADCVMTVATAIVVSVDVIARTSRVGASHPIQYQPRTAGQKTIAGIGFAMMRNCPGSRHVSGLDHSVSSFRAWSVQILLHLCFSHRGATLQKSLLLEEYRCPW